MEKDLYLNNSLNEKIIYYNYNYNKNTLIDAHCHFQDFTNEEISSIIIRCKEKNISFFLTNSTNKNDFERTLNISNSNKELIPGFGYHPWYLDEPVNNENWFEDYKNYIKYLEEMKIIYFIGEIGIDGGKPKKYKKNL